MKYIDSIDKLKRDIESVGFKIIESTSLDRQERIKTENGAIVNFFITTGTLQFQGKPQIKEELEKRLLELIRSKSSESKTSKDANLNKKVFVVHGHDTAAKEQLELILLKLKLEPFVLANTSGGGLTIIESLEQEIGSESDKLRFGIVLLTPDDIGYAKSEGEGAAKDRARQNVVLEMGMLISSIGRPNVAILKKGETELPSDAHGIIYHQFSDHVKEIVPRLVDHMRKSGFDIGVDELTSAAS